LTPVDLAASVRARLLKGARERHEEFQRVLDRFAVERLLYRISQSPEADRFVLKGAQLFVVWTSDVLRPTRDLDLLCFGDWPPEQLESYFRRLCTLAVAPDGLVFDAGSVEVRVVRQDRRYQGHRLKLRGRLGKARVTVQIDIGHGDVVTPEPVAFPTLLADLPPPRLKAYPPEALVAEKFAAMVEYGDANSRMKDYFDLDFLARDRAFEGARLAPAIGATFRRHGHALPEGIPAGLRDEWAKGPIREELWRGFTRSLGPDFHGTVLADVVGRLRAFLLPPLDALRIGGPWDARWPPGGPWSASRSG